MGPKEPELRSDALIASWEDLQAVGEEAREIAGDLTREQLWWRPGTERWSVGECLDHLVRTGEAYLEALDESIGDAREQGLFATGSRRRTLMGRLLVRVLEPPPGLKVPAPGEIRPRRPGGGEPADEDPGPRTGGPASGPGRDRNAGHAIPLQDFLDLRPRFAERLEAADGLELYRARVTSPFFRWIRFDLGSAFDVVAAHERRHLWQARQVKESEAFPGDRDGR